jgi:hypothetical protein
MTLHGDKVKSRQSLPPTVYETIQPATVDSGNPASMASDDQAVNVAVVAVDTLTVTPAVVAVDTLTITPAVVAVCNPSGIDEAVPFNLTGFSRMFSTVLFAIYSISKLWKYHCCSFSFNFDIFSCKKK